MTMKGKTKLDLKPKVSEPALNTETPVSEKTTKRTPSEKTKLIQRLSRIEGQIGGIRRMIESDAYCIDVLTQSSAVSGAIEAFNRELLKNHIRNCFVNGIRAGQEEPIDELIKILDRLIK